MKFKIIDENGNSVAPGFYHCVVVKVEDDVVVLGCPNENCATSFATFEIDESKSLKPQLKKGYYATNEGLKYWDGDTWWDVELSGISKQDPLNMKFLFEKIECEEKSNG